MKYDLFLSYANEEKEKIARPLAEDLRKQEYNVWFDAHVMAVGDSIKESVDKGIINSEYGVIIISSAYLTKSWTTYELNWFAAKEDVGKQNSIIPIWHNIHPNEVISFITSKTQDGNQQSSSLPAIVVELIKKLTGKSYINTELGINGVIAKIIEIVPKRRLLDNAYSTITKEDEQKLLQTSYAIELYNEWHWASFKKSTEYVRKWITTLELSHKPVIPLSVIENEGGYLEYHVFEIIHFYEKWALLSKSNVIDKKQVSKLLGSYSIYFEDHLIRPLIKVQEENIDFVNLLSLIQKEILN